MREVRVGDVTMQAAVSAKALTLSFKEKLELAKLLDRLGVSVIEVEGVSSEKVDSLRIKSLASIVKNSVLAVPVALDGSDIELIWDALREASRARLQVIAAVSPAQMEYIYRKKANAMAEAIVEMVKKCAALTSDVEFVAEDATRADRAFLCETVAAAIEAGATTVTINDAAGAMLPEEFGAFVAGLLEDIPALKDITLAISCSNEMYMADACAVAGIMAGADEVKVTSYPMNTTSTNKLAKILEFKKDTCQVECPIQTIAINRIMAQIAWICEKGQAKDAALSVNIADADASIVLTEHDDLETVSKAALKLGYELSPEDAVSVYEAFQRIASKKDSVGSRELDAIVASAALQVPPTYVIDNYVINSGNTIKATARVQMTKDDAKLEAVCIGDGPIDAALLAIEQIIGRHYELDDFQIQAVTEGKEAMGETVVKLESNGKIYSGRGISTDIVGAAIRAFVNAVNKIVYEEAN